VSRSLSCFSISQVTIDFNLFSEESIIALMAFEELEDIGTHLRIKLRKVSFAPGLKRLIHAQSFEDWTVKFFINNNFIMISNPV
jgi:hypothetical protein